MSEIALENVDLPRHDDVQTLDISIDNNNIMISRNYEDVLNIPSGHKNKNLIALIDSIMHPEKYSIQVHDLRTKEIWSKMSFEKEARIG